jgi:hypothetical protein
MPSAIFLLANGVSASAPEMLWRVLNRFSTSRTDGEVPSLLLFFCLFLWVSPYYLPTRAALLVFRLVALAYTLAYTTDAQTDGEPARVRRQLYARHGPRLPATTSHSLLWTRVRSEIQLLGR